MLTIEKILFPTDLSESSLQTLPLATHLAELHGSDLHMFHVYALATGTLRCLRQTPGTGQLAVSGALQEQ